MVSLLVTIGILLSAVGFFSLAGIYCVHKNPDIIIIARWITAEKLLVLGRFIKGILFAYCVDVLCLYVILIADLISLVRGI